MKRSNLRLMRIEEKDETKVKEQKIFSTNSQKKNLPKPRERNVYVGTRCLWTTKQIGPEKQFPTIQHNESMTYTEQRKNISCKIKATIPQNNWMNV